MHEQLLLLKKIAEYFNKIQKTEIANIINEELQKEVEKNPDFSEPDYVKDDLPTIFFRHVTLKRRKSEASMRKSMANNTKNLQKSKKSVVNFAPSSPSMDENQENHIEINNNPIEHLDETSHSILAPINTNRISENILTRSQFLPDLGSTPNHNHARSENNNNVEIKLENVDVNEFNVNENNNNNDNEDDNNSLVMYDPQENFHQTIYDSDNLDDYTEYDISNLNTDYEEFRRESQLDFKKENVSQLQEHENNNYAENEEFVLKQSAGSPQYIEDNLESEINQSHDGENNLEAINELNISQPQCNGNDLEEPNQSETSQSHDWKNVTKPENQLQNNPFDEYLNDNEEILQQNKTNQSDFENDIEGLIDKESVTNQISDQNNLNFEAPFENLSFQCGQIPIEIYDNSDNDHTAEQDLCLLEPNVSQDLFETENEGDNCERLIVTNEIAIQCDPEELLNQPIDSIKNKQKRFNESDETDNPKKRKIDNVDLDIEEIEVEVAETTVDVPKRVRACSLSSIESLPAGDPDPQPVVKPKRKVTHKAAVIFKENKKLDIKRRILLTDGWLLWPSSLLSGCLKHYDVDSFLEVIDWEINRDKSWTRREVLNVYLENMYAENLIHKFYHSGKKHDLFVKLSLLPEDLLDSLDINLETYHDNLWNKNLGPKNGRKLCAEGAPRVVRDLLNLELNFLDIDETVIL